MDVPGLPMNTGVRASYGADTLPDDSYAAATVLRSESVDWLVVVYW